MNILVVSAHPDDLELMCGGSVARWVQEKHRVHALTVTDGSWHNPSGQVVRSASDALAEEKQAASILGYQLENLQRATTTQLQFDDGLVCAVLERIQKYRIDTLICPFDGDLLHDHEIVSRIVWSAGKRVPRILMGQINWYIRQPFVPHFFVDISRTWEKKIEALQCYRSEYSRTGEEWRQWLDETTRTLGRALGVERAEGFVCRKFLW